MPAEMQASVGAVYAAQENWVLMLSVCTLYWPRQRSVQAGGTPTWTQQGRWSRPSAMHSAIIGKSASQSVGLTPATRGKKKISISISI